MSLEVHGESSVAAAIPKSNPLGIGSASAPMCADDCRPSPLRGISLRCCIVGKDPRRGPLVKRALIEKGAEPFGGALLSLVNLWGLEKGLEIPHDTSLAVLRRTGERSKQEQRGDYLNDSVF